MRRNPITITPDSKAREVKKIARKLYDIGVNMDDLETDYYRNRLQYLYNITGADWYVIKECIGWWFLDFERRDVI